MNISFNYSHGNQDEAVLLGKEDAPKAKHQLPLQTAGFAVVSVPVEVSPRPHGTHSCVPSLQADRDAERGKFGCNKEETTSSSLWLLAEPDLPVQNFWGLPSLGIQARAAQGLRSRNVLEGVIPELKQHDSRQS